MNDEKMRGKINLIKAEFGIIDKIEKDKDYSEYEPHRYHCVFIDDDAYINDWWNQLILMKTYFHNLNRPEMGLARWGVTLIPLESLGAFQDIVISDKRINKDKQLVLLAEKIEQAIRENKYMIHYGI